jgi:DNA-binding NtrC family response regulator
MEGCMVQILFLEEEKSLLHIFGKIFSRECYQEKLNVDFVENEDQAKFALESKNFDLLVVDTRGDGNHSSGLKFLRLARENNYWMPAIIYTELSSEKVLQELNGKNCFTVLPKNITIDAFVQKIMDAVYLVTEGSQHITTILAKTTQLVQKLTA